jgi:uncharacterized protein (DUF58 family)
VPNGRTPGLVAVLIGMWYAGASQNNGAAYLLCFVLTSLALVSAVHAWGHLRGIRLRVDSIPPVFAGENVTVRIAAGTTRLSPHYDLQIQINRAKTSGTITRLDKEREQQATMQFHAPRRGCYHELAVKLSTTYPLGFFTAQQEFLLRQTYHVYPAAIGEHPLPLGIGRPRNPRSGQRVAGDDYGGVRAWQPGESQRHIDWKSAARGQPLLTKQWTGEADELLRFDWQELGALDTETRLCQLAKWVVVAERGDASYELHLPGKTISAGRGHTHYHACLRALAEFNEPRA